MPTPDPNQDPLARPPASRSEALEAELAMLEAMLPPERAPAPKPAPPEPPTPPTEGTP